MVRDADAGSFYVYRNSVRGCKVRSLTGVFMEWYEYEKKGWCWAEGWSADRGGYYAQAWRNLPKSVQVDGRWVRRECITEGGKSTREAGAKVRQRIDGLERK